MTKAEFHREALDLLQKEALVRSKRTNRLGFTIILLLLGTIGSYFYWFMNHENRLSNMETTQETYLNNSGVEFTARSIGKEIEDRLEKKIDKKANIDFVQVVNARMIRIENKIDKNSDKINKLK